MPNSIYGKKKITIITKDGFNLRSYFAELFSRIELVYFFCKRDFVVLYKQTILGPLWYLIQPFLTSLVFLIIFNKFAKLTTEGVPGILFYYIGNISWIFFSSTIQSVGLTLIVNAELYKKVYFPRIAMPLSTVLVGYIKFTFQFLLFLILFLYYCSTGFIAQTNINILLVPLFLLHLGIITIALGLIVASITVKYRDLAVTLNFGIQLLMFATPIIYSFNSIPEKYKFFGYLNPLVPIFENIRNAFFGIELIEFKYYFSSIGLTVLLFFIAIKLFIRAEKNFIDTV